MNDYIIAVDRDGVVYLSHARRNKQNHKYIAKIGEGVKARYFYTQQELDTCLRNKVNDKKFDLEYETGLFNRKHAMNAKEEYKKADTNYRIYNSEKNKASKEKARIDYENSMKNYVKTPLGKIENTKIGYKLINKYADKTPFFNDTVVGSKHFK